MRQLRVFAFRLLGSSVAVTVVAALLVSVSAQQRFELPDTVERRAVDIWSEGTRMAGDLYWPSHRAEDDTEWQPDRRFHAASVREERLELARGTGPGVLVHLAAAYLQQRRVGAQAADGRLPHVSGLGIEDDIEVDLGREPGRRRELGVQLAGIPTGIPGEQPGAWRRRPLEQTA